LQTAAPQCLPADLTGARADIIKHGRAAILLELEGKTDVVQVGPMYQVGVAWRLIGGPSHGMDEESGPDKLSPEVEKLVAQLGELDKKNSGAMGTGPNPDTVRYHLARVDLLEKLIEADKPEQRESWIRQVADSLSTAVQASPAADKTAANRLASLEKLLVARMPGSNLAAYVVYRRLQAENATRGSGDPKDFTKTQQEWSNKLAKFVEAYPKAEDTPDALLQLGMVNEILGKDVDAKNWYGQLVKSCPDKPQGIKAAGAIRRLGMEGKVFQLSGPLLTNPEGTFDVAKMRGKIVIVYYYGSWNDQCASDFAKLKKLITDNEKTVDLLCINLDENADKAREFLRDKSAPGTHLYQGGMDSKLATSYGVMVLPNLFLVGKDGKVLSRNVQMGNLEDEVKKHVKK
jgi:hypothetical protein